MKGRAVRGREGVRRLFQEIEEQFDEWSITVDEWHDAGDRVALLGRVHLHGRQSGIAFDQPVGWLFEVRAGLLYRMETFLDNPAEVLEAAGLREWASQEVTPRKSSNTPVPSERTVPRIWC